MDQNTPKLNLSELFKPTAKNPLKTYSPSTAIQFINSERSKREYSNHSTLDLLGLEEEITSRLRWFDETNKPQTDSDKRSLESIVKELARSEREDLSIARIEFTKRNKWSSLYPDDGPLRRELYVKHMEAYALGESSNERLILGSNRSGKTICGAYESTCHVTGVYPSWWEGHKFYEPLHIWVGNKGAKEVRDINEQELLGPTGNLALRGTGMLPGHRIIKCTPKSGTPNAVEFIDVKHVSGGQSRIQSKSFDQGREAYQGTAIPFIWLDEECPEDIYGECVMRTMTCNGLILVTYTPIQGLTALTTQFLDEAGIKLDAEPLTQSTAA